MDLARDEIVVHRAPSAGTFGAISRHRQGTVAALHHAGVVVEVGDLLR